MDFTLGVRMTAWFLVGLLLFCGWWAKYVFDSVEPFKGLHSGREWISWEQLSPEARAFAQVRYDRCEGDLAWSVVFDQGVPHDHLLVVGVMILHRRLLSPEQRRMLCLNRHWGWAAEGRERFSTPPAGRMNLETLLRCTWNPEWELKWALDSMVETGKISQFRRAQLLSEFSESP